MEVKFCKENDKFYFSINKESYPNEEFDISREPTFTSYIENIKKFINEIKNIPNYELALPERQLEEMRLFTETGVTLMKQHPFFTLTNSKRIFDSLNCMQKSIEDELKKILERQLNFKGTQQLKACITAACEQASKELKENMNDLKKYLYYFDSFIKFQENPDLLISIECNFPLLEVAKNLLALQEETAIFEKYLQLKDVNIF